MTETHRDAVPDVGRPDFLWNEEFGMFARSVGRFLDEHAGPSKLDQWRRDGVIERDRWTKAGAAGLLGLSMPAEYGGVGGDSATR